MKSSKNQLRPLTPEEILAVPIVIDALRGIRKTNPIRSKLLLVLVNLNLWQVYPGHKGLVEVRLRKIINHIRMTSKLPVLANNAGYYVSFDKEDIIESILSLRVRAQSINAASNGLSKFLD